MSREWDNWLRMNPVERAQFERSFGKPRPTLWDRTAEWVIIAAMFLVVIVLCGGGWVVKSHFEAKTFNRVTGEHITTWDAMWADYRVQAPPKADR